MINQPRPSTRWWIVLVLAVALGGEARAQLFESYYMHEGNYPVGETPWSDDIQGLAHDDHNWFITTTHFIWKIPVTLDLATAGVLSPGVIRRSIGEYIQQIPGYNHFGDPDTYTYAGVDYLVVPIENGESTCSTGLPGAVMFVLCSDLSYVWHAAFPGQCNDAGWVAIDDLGFMMSSRQHVGNRISLPPCQGDGLRYYAFEWDALSTTGQGNFQFIQEVHPTDELGDCLEMVTMQGGEFSPGDGLLYLVSGFYDDEDGLEDREGIHVLDTSTYRRVQHSTRGFGHFDYYYDPGFPTYEEPEGLTIWNLDDGRAPGIFGQLHVFVSDNDIDIGDSGDVDFKHYTRAVRVDATSGASCQNGSQACPFHTLAAGVAFAWSGAEIRIRGGSYPDPISISQRVRLSAENGVARVGE
ncbi:MAG: hypothetical protein CHACPFDD_02983 [Phycisphaerae bacterium]|nr:hypothetical protein [Phycisphaerae bacterium]